jgi:hypothetical protein
VDILKGIGCLMAAGFGLSAGPIKKPEHAGHVPVFDSFKLRLVA